MNILSNNFIFFHNIILMAIKYSIASLNYNWYYCFDIIEHLVVLKFLLV